MNRQSIKVMQGYKLTSAGLTAGMMFIVLIGWGIVSLFTQNTEHIGAPEYVKHAPGIAAIAPQQTSTPLPPLSAMTALSESKLRHERQTILSNMVMEDLQIELLGTSVADKHSAAIVRLLPEKMPRVVFIGNMLHEDVQLKTIENRAIMVAHAGKLTRITLTMRKEKSAEASRHDGSKAKTTRKSPHVILVQPNLKQALDAIPDSISSNEPSDVTPYLSRRGKAKGYYAQDIFPSALISSMGLQGEDVVSRVNQIKLNNPNNIGSAIMLMKNSQNIKIIIRRANKKLTLHFKVK